MSDSSSSNLGIPIAIFLAGVVVAFAIIISNGFFDKSEIPSEAQQTIVKETETQEEGAVPSADEGVALGEQTATKVSEDDDPVKGSENAPVVLIEFSDYQCPFCKKYVDETYEMIIKEYVDTGKVKYIFRDFPLDFHTHAQKAAEAAECADDQGKYWEYHDILFENQKKWESLTEATGTFKSYAKELGLKAADFNSCLDNGNYTDEIKKDYNDGVAAGVNGTPGFVINGNLLIGAQPFSAFKQLIDSELNK